MNNEYQDKVVLVTGGGRGIGRAICIEYAKKGAIVIINFASNEQAALETKKLCEQEVLMIQDSCNQKLQEGELECNQESSKSLSQDEQLETGYLSEDQKISVYKADVSNSNEVEEMIKSIVKTYGKIDILINNAGITKDNLMLRMSEQDFSDVIDINLKGTFLCLKEASKYMIKKRSGRIVNISSVSGIVGNAGQANYSSSKAGIIGLTKASAKELAARNITVNAVAPGFVETDMTSSLPADMMEKVKEMIPLKRLGKPEDIAKTVCFLTSEAADYITGQVIQVDGGLA